MTRATDRQLAVMAAYLATGSQKAAAFELGRSVQTVRNSLSALRGRLGADCLAQVAYELHDELAAILPAEREGS